ncbi:hypothetical protein [Paraburkholderia acidiphila]|uniref:Uncharacterized protein n=1 Tax=Paraburkholderia acidiphila TaxID=2571747 RepID=A0A7Z2JBA0_9BURK|nr:hypothetical protein [Paraburkholderia acidiphila]QGZ58792.1 hypothetical protein FAZ97_27970 [Paraburkholderia acidiphila]
MGTDLLQESWAGMSVSVSEQFPQYEREVGHETQAVLGGADRGGAQAAELGMPVARLIRPLCISEQTY